MADASESLRLIKYTILQSIVIPSLLCDVLVFSYFIRHWRKEFVTAPQNHVTLALLIISSIQKIADVPLLLYYFRWGIVPHESTSFCRLWIWADSLSTVGSIHLVTWFSLERHLFVFHGTMMKKRRCLILFHHIPLMVIIVYAPLYYANVILFQTFCADVFDYTLPLCGYACYLNSPVFVTVDIVFHFGFASLIIIVSNAVLFIRFIAQKVRHQRAVYWSRQRRLILQLAFVSFLFLICFSPLLIVTMIQTFWIPDFLMDIMYDYFYFLPYFANLLLPFTIVSSLPKMRSELYNWMLRWKMSCRHPQRTHPTLETSLPERRRPNAITVLAKSSRWHMLLAEHRPETFISSLPSYFPLEQTLRKTRHHHSDPLSSRYAQDPISLTREHLAVVHQKRLLSISSRTEQGAKSNKWAINSIHWSSSGDKRESVWWWIAEDISSIHLYSPHHNGGWQKYLDNESRHFLSKGCSQFMRTTSFAACLPVFFHQKNHCRRLSEWDLQLIHFLTIHVQVFSTDLWPSFWSGQLMSSASASYLTQYVTKVVVWNGQEYHWWDPTSTNL